MSETVKNVIGGLITFAFIALVFTGMFFPWKTEGTITSVSYNQFGNWADVQFDDGRTMRLSGQPPRSLNRGKYYVITYNSIGWFYSVEERD